MAGFFLCPSDEISPVCRVFFLYHLCRKIFPLWGTVLKSVVRFFSVLLFVAVVLAGLVPVLIHLYVDVCIYTHVGALIISHLVLLTRKTTFQEGLSGVCMLKKLFLVSSYASIIVISNSLKKL